MTWVGVVAILTGVMYLGLLAVWLVRAGRVK